MIKTLKIVLGNFFKYLFSKRNIPKLIKSYINDISIFTMRGIGDICYTLSFLGAIKKQNPDKKIIIFAGDDSNKKTINFFSEFFDKIIYIEPKKFIKLMEGLVAFGRRCEHFFSSKQKIYVSNYFELFVNSFYRAKYDLIKLTKEVIYNLEGNCDLIFPTVQRIDDQYLVNKFNIKIGKSIVLSPYSKSNSYKNISAYETIADYYIKKGYKIFTNLAPGQIPIKNTTPLNCEIDELFNLIPLCNYIVGLRSGIMDLIISTETTIIVEYDINFEQKNLYTLHGWGINENVYEYSGPSEGFVNLVKEVIG